MSRLDHIAPSLWPTLAKQAGYRGKRLAELCGVSCSTLRRFVWMAFGKGLEDWLERLALCEVARQIAETDDQVKICARNAEFKSMSHFTHRFEAMFGCRPLEFRTLFRLRRAEQGRRLTALGGPGSSEEDLPPPMWVRFEGALCSTIRVAPHITCTAKAPLEPNGDIPSTKDGWSPSPGPWPLRQRH